MTTSPEDAVRIAAEVCALRDFAEAQPYNRKVEMFLNEQFDNMATNSLIREVTTEQNR